MKVLFLNVWPEIGPASRAHLDHSAHQIWHVCEMNGVKYLQSFVAEGDIAGLTMVESDDVGILVDLLKSVFEKFPFERVVAIDEMTMLPAAYIRDVFNIPGPRLADVDYYRNKRKMKDRLAEKGIRVIRDIDPPVGGAAFPLPCVVKRPDGAAALGVQICRTAEEFEGQRDALAGGSLLEEYVEGDFFHVDGAFNEHGLAAVPHAYLNNCYNHYVNREPLGSVGIDDQRLKRRLLDFAEQVLRALPLPEGVFHLEIIRNKNDELVFLEIACRLGGGEIYTNFLDVYGVDLVGYSIDSQLGLHPKLPRPRDDLIAGTLLMNNYSHFPGLFSAVRMGPLAEDNCMYAARIPKLGRRVADRTYDFISFVFRGKTSEAVCDSISDVISNATLESVAVPD